MLSLDLLKVLKSYIDTFKKQLSLISFHSLCVKRITLCNGLSSSFYHSDIRTNLHFHKTCDYQIWPAGTSRGVVSHKTNQAGDGDVITSGSRIIKIVILPIKKHDNIWPYNHVVLRDHLQTKIIIYPLSRYLWLPKLAGWVHIVRSFLP